MGHSLFFIGSSRKVGEANKGLGEAPKSCTRKEHESATNSIAKGVKGGLRPFSSAPCRVKGQRPLWGLGQRPNCSASDQHRKRTQQRRRQRSVPASNFARPQTRLQADLPPSFREEPNFRVRRAKKRTVPFCRTVRRNYFRRVMTMWRFGSSPSEWVSTSSLGWSAE